MTRPEPKESILGFRRGWTISRNHFFYIAVAISFLWFWIPNYVFRALSTFNWMTWIAPQNLTLAILTGSNLGLGLFNPITTFDWNIATSSFAALSMPFFAVAQQYVGALIGACVILAMYYSNVGQPVTLRSPCHKADLLCWFGR